MNRKKLPRALQLRLENYYGGKICVISGASEGADWAHLDDNNQNTVFENLVPLSHSYNRLQEEWRRKQSAGDPRIPLGVDLQSRFLYHVVHKHFQAGRPALAVGGCWLGVHLAEKYRREFDAIQGEDWAYLSQTLFYLPYRMDTDLLRAALRRVCFNVARSHSPPPFIKSAVLLSIANLYQDLQLWSRAEEIYDLLERHLSSNDPARPAMLRRRSVSEFIRHGATKWSRSQVR